MDEYNRKPITDQVYHEADKDMREAYTQKSHQQIKTEGDRPMTDLDFMSIEPNCPIDETDLNNPKDMEEDYGWSDEFDGIYEDLMDPREKDFDPSDDCAYDPDTD